VSREECVDELTKPDTTPVTRKIAHRYLEDYEGLRLGYDPTGPIESVPEGVRELLHQFKEEHYEGSWWQVQDRMEHIPPDEFPERIETAAGRERENLLASFTCWTPRTFFSTPPELQFSCAIMLDGHEGAWAKLLASSRDDLRPIAARILWERHSRRYAHEVMETVSGSRLPAWQGVRSLVESDLRPENILRELDKGDFAWGAWLAGLRPHPSLVPGLLKRLESPGKRAESPAPEGAEDRLPFGLTRSSMVAYEGRKHRVEAILALGKSGDRRAIEPLLSLLSIDDYELPGRAAQALGYFRAASAEQALIDALSRDNGWLRVKACGALAKIGTRRAVPALQMLADDPSYTGALNVRGMARHAITEILKRDPGRPQGTPRGTGADEVQGPP
jgi:hypothetical protein